MGEMREVFEGFFPSRNLSETKFVELSDRKCTYKTFYLKKNNISVRRPSRSTTSVCICEHVHLIGWLCVCVETHLGQTSGLHVLFSSWLCVCLFCCSSVSGVASKMADRLVACAPHRAVTLSPMSFSVSCFTADIVSVCAALKSHVQVSQITDVLLNNV